MTWIHTIPPDQAVGKLGKVYQRIAGDDGEVDNILQVHSLRPHTLQGHMGLYKSVLHHSGNLLPRTTMELLGVWVSHLNRCSYCVEHHFAGLKDLMNQNPAADLQRDALQSGYWDEVFDSGTQAMLRYAEALTIVQIDVKQSHVEAMREAGLDDGQILEVNQVVSYFNYANRTVVGLGVSLQGDELGSSPSDQEDEDNWQHVSSGKAPTPGGKSNVGKHKLRGSVASRPGYRPTIHTVHGRAFSTKHIQFGDPWFDYFFRLTAGVCLGSAIGRVAYFGAGTMVTIEGKWPSHPISDGVAYGFIASVPICILYYLWRKLQVSTELRRGRDSPEFPRYIGRPAIVITFCLTWTWLWLTG